MNLYTDLQFRSTFDSLSGRESSLAALIDIADGLPCIEYEWVRNALLSRGLIVSNAGRNPETGAYEAGLGYRLTDYGAAFTKWLRQPRDIPQTKYLFGDDEVQP